MISKTTEYALRAMVTLATSPDHALSSREIARRTQVPGNYLAKVLQNLVRHGLVSSQRGVNGGVLLSRPPGRITVLDIVTAVDPIMRITKCPLNLRSHGLSLCPLHRKLDQALSQAEQVFRSTTLEELVRPTASARERERPCEFPRAIPERPSRRPRRN